MSNKKDVLHKELKLKTEVEVDGINFKPSVFKDLALGTEYMEQVHTGFEMDRLPHVGINYPVGFYLPNGLFSYLRWSPESSFDIRKQGLGYVLLKNKKEVAEIDFIKRPGYYALKTSDGEPMSHVANFIPDGCLIVCYSNECSLKEKGKDCLFCNINTTADTYSEAEGIFWKTPKQIGEAIAAGFKEGIGDHVTITGGFVPERREVEYYFDVGEEIKKHTGLEDFNGTAVIGAPLDFSVIEKYKEIGYRTIAMNLEIWDKNIWKTICPGKDEVCGGWDNWVKALEYSVKVFGHGRVRSNFVAGIEPKKTILEGVEYLASKGVVNQAGAWCPNPGSDLEGHRTPEPEWHLDLNYRIADIFRKYGFTYKQLYDCSPGSSFLTHDIYKIEEGFFDKGQEAPVQIVA